MQVFSSRFGKGITVLVWVVLSLALVQAIVELGFWSASRSFPAAALISFLCWLVFYRPRIEFENSLVRLINIFQSVEIPYSAIKRVDTRWALEIHTDAGKHVAWGAPAPGRHTALFASKDQGEHLPESSYVIGTVRPGDLINTDSGAAAANLRRELEKVEFEGGKVNASVNKTSILVVVILVLLTAITL